METSDLGSFVISSPKYPGAFPTLSHVRRCSHRVGSGSRNSRQAPAPYAFSVRVCPAPAELPSSCVLSWPSPELAPSSRPPGADVLSAGGAQTVADARVERAPQTPRWAALGPSLAALREASFQFRGPGARQAGLRSKGASLDLYQYLQKIIGSFQEAAGPRRQHHPGAQ